LRRAVVITNPNASRAAVRGLAPALARLRAGGLAVELARTDAPGHGEQLAREALAGGADLLIAHGGDGTIMEVAAAVVGTRTPVGILPAGTGNRLADNLGIGRGQRAATETILRGRVRAIDLGRFISAEGKLRYFAVAAGCGADAETMHLASPRWKRILGIGAYVGAALRTAAALRRADVRIETDDGIHEMPAVMVMVANCGGIVPFTPPFSPRIVPDDGYFDVVILDARTFQDAALAVTRLLVGRPDGERAITFLRARRAHVVATPDLPAQADGEPAGRSPFTAELIAGGLTVLAPPAP
jgi:diacylglycerol kinase (ATP)